jgi:hypothetical protein
LDIFDLAPELSAATAIFNECWEAISNHHQIAAGNAHRNRAYVTILFLTLWCGGDQHLAQRYFISAHGGNFGLEKGRFHSGAFLHTMQYYVALPEGKAMFELLRTRVIRSTGQHLQDSSDSETGAETANG